MNMSTRHASQQMSITIPIPRVVVGETLVLEIRAQDPSGIKQISIECYHFSLWNSTRCKAAFGEYSAPVDAPSRGDTYKVPIALPEDAATGQWGIKSIRFVNGRNYTSTFYRGQDRFDNFIFEVLPLPAEQEVSLRFDGVSVANTPQE
jgi:hypothetical protein